MVKFYAIILSILLFDGALLTFLAFAYHAKRFEPFRISLKESMKTPSAKRLANIAFLAILLVYDFAYYWLHRLMHTTRGMRWVHGRHHEVRNPTAMESFYLTPAELFAGLGLLLACTWLLGPVSIYSFAVVFFIHTTLNITVHSGLLSKRLLLWPIDHLTHKHYTHHAGNYDNNFASLTPFWDMLFR